MTDSRPTWAEIDLGAIEHNVATLRAIAEPAALMAVVKANGYGHGTVPVAEAALGAGATWLGVARVEEGAELRAAGIDAPVMLLSEPPTAVADEVVAARLTPLVGESTSLGPLAAAAARAGTTLSVHLKVDTGMHRVGCAPGETTALARVVRDRAELSLDGIATHLAVADAPGDPFTGEQLRLFALVLDELVAAGLRPPIVHAANSAGLMAHADARFDLARVGIAVYGQPPSTAVPGIERLRPALTWRAQVTAVHDLAAGERVSYGRHYALPRAGRVLTLPVGYGDGVPRRLGLVGGEVVVHGRRRPVAGAVTMDQLMVDAGDLPVSVGDEVTLLGEQAGPDGETASVTATEWADRLDTINYEIVTGIRSRVPRVYR